MRIGSAKGNISVPLQTKSSFFDFVFMKYPVVQNFIGGNWKAASGKRVLPVVSPLDGQLLSEVAMSTAADLNEAVKAAQAAFPSWSKTPVKERVQVFFRYKTLLDKHLKELAELCT